MPFSTSQSGVPVLIAIAAIAFTGGGWKCRRGRQPGADPAHRAEAGRPRRDGRQAVRLRRRQDLRVRTNPAPVFAFTWQNPVPVPGLTFATTGLVSGAPLVAGTFKLAFQVTDVSGAAGACTSVTSDTGTLVVAAAPTSAVVPVGSSNNQVVPPNTPVPRRSRRGWWTAAARRWPRSGDVDREPGRRNADEPGAGERCPGPGAGGVHDRRRRAERDGDRARDGDVGDVRVHGAEPAIGGGRAGAAGDVASGGHGGDRPTIRSATCASGWTRSASSTVRR